MDNRKHPRFPVQFNSSFSSANNVAGDGTLVDLSLRGCHIASATGVQPGTIMQIRLRVKPNEPLLQIDQAVVRWYRAAHFGVEFVTLSAEGWTRLQRVVKSLEEQPYRRGPSEMEAA
jgi:c-di-GMP-binding flagellar brake protein YcgR